MNGLVLLCSAGVVLGAMIPVLPPSPTQGKQEQTSPGWAGQSDLLADLSAEVNMSTFRLRPPKGYGLVEQPGPRGSKASAWKGAARPDGTSPWVMVAIAPIPPEETNVSTLEEALDKFLDAVRRRRVDFQRTRPEVGQVNGVTFIRARWDGTEPDRQLRMHGFMYVAIDGRTVIQLASQDVEPHHEKALKLAEAALLTFQRR